MCRQTN